MQGKVFGLYIAESPEKEMQSMPSVTLEAGKGIIGDRYFSGRGTFSERLKGQPSVELTLIEKEAIDHFNRQFQQEQGYGDFRRNIVTMGIRLNDLVEHKFRLGELELKGVRLCEPCDHLAKTVNPLVLPHMIGHCGLRAQILASGEIKCGDSLSAYD